ncbi:MAG: hypothetical protein KJZ98_03340 [Burkholderiaceae bacterium]|jgi:UDP-N-acetyl-D-mannosaminuronate dehydrogenase|nr:hypothetical protein [Burkholderiaceae bacterium]MEB2350899.1 hypothetical protein [Burkholderiaceae bacterium]
MSTVAVVGLGYVGLPLAVEFGKFFQTIGYDLSPARVEHLRRHEDSTGEVSREQFDAARGLEISDDPAQLARADFLVVAVPTPVDAGHSPDFSSLLLASETCGRYMKRGATVVYESTVYPGATEEICIDPLEVLKAAGTKWNFLPFRPGLVGGHCIGVDPHYLTHKAEMLGYHPQVILAGRRINDGMGAFIAQRIVKEMITAGFAVKDAPVIVLGLTFKEDVPDLRNSKVIDVVRELGSYGARVYLHDPVAHPDEAHQEYGVTLTGWDALPKAAAIVVAVSHAQYRQLGLTVIAAKAEPGAIFADVKSAFERTEVEAAGLRAWRL